MHYLDLDQNRHIHVERLALGLKEHQMLQVQLCVGWTPGIIQNEAEVQQVLQEQEIPIVVSWKQLNGQNRSFVIICEGSNC